jgi:hypothetical protein
MDIVLPGVLIIHAEAALLLNFFMGHKPTHRVAAAYESSARGMTGSGRGFLLRSSTR